MLETVEVKGEDATYRVQPERLLGRGGFGHVFLGVRLPRTEGEKAISVAAKRLPTLTGLKDAEFEMRGLRNVSQLNNNTPHPNLVQCLDFNVAPNQVWIIFEYMNGGSLDALIRRRTRLPEDLIAALTRDALRGLLHLHSNGMVHRDIKPANMLLTSTGSLKLGDFGLAKNAADPTSGRGRSGTEPFMAPEVFSSGQYSAARDIWALGCSVVEMCGGNLPPYPGHNNRYPEPPPTAASDALQSFCRQCLQLDPTQRPDANALLQHPFLAVSEPPQQMPPPPPVEDEVWCGELPTVPAVASPNTAAAASRSGSLQELAQRAPPLSDLLRRSDGQKLAAKAESMTPPPSFFLWAPQPGSFWVHSTVGIVVSAYYHPTQEHATTTDGDEGRIRVRSKAGDWALSFQDPCPSQPFVDRVLFNTAGTSEWNG